jgi:outer membrane protein OmpA-like peptidoglycan-associated protein
MKMARTTTLLGAALIGLAACSEGDGTYEQTNTGALVGAGVGAALGQLIGGDREATIIGAAVGAGVGGAIGNELEKQEDALRRDIGGSGAQIINTGGRLVVRLPEAITFAVDSAEVRGSIQDDLFAVARNLQQYPNNTVQVIGHTDSSGSDAYNQTLSERRARAVANILLAGGVPSSRVVAFGVGESQPIASNESADGRQANRRVEIIITPR